METLLTSNMYAFLAGLVVGLLIGTFLGFYIGLKKSNQPVIMSTLLGGGFAMLWAGLHTYAILSGDIEVPLLFDVVGGLAMGQTLGIDLASAVQKMKR